MPSKRLFVFGLGYTASRAARAFHSAGYVISGTVRSAEAAAQLSQADAQLFRVEDSATVFLFDGKEWCTSNALPLDKALQGVTHVLISVPTGHVDGQEDPVLSSLGGRLVPALHASVQWVGYLSTIGVYGETNGVTVDESAPVHSSVKRSQRRIRAEQLWLASGLPVHIFRLAGIYGPGRGMLTTVRRGTATRIHMPGRHFHRIHVEDLINILLASAARPNPGRVYNVCDDEPAPAHQVTAYACELLGVSVPPLQSWDDAEKQMSAMAKSFYAESKRCSNKRVKDELGVTLWYPTYREGLLAQVLEEDKEVPTERQTPRHSVFAHSNPMPRLIVLVSTGSLRATPYRALRQISFQVSRALRQPVVPCSMQASDRVDLHELNGLEAQTFETVLTHFLAVHTETATEVIVLLLCMEQCAMVTDVVPTILDRVRPSTLLSMRIGNGLLETASDTRIAHMLLEHIATVVDISTTSDDVTVLVVDHGVPSHDVHTAREVVAQQLRALLPPNHHLKRVGTARMERHKGIESAVNEPLLAEALDYYGVNQGIVVCATLFFSHGCDAGAEDDIDAIVQNVRANHPNVDVRVTEGLGTHAMLTEILHDRYHAALAKETPDYTLAATT